MFSEKFYIVEKYNLDSREYVGTYENMFTEFTSIENQIYKPELDENLLNKFRKVLSYKFDNNTTPFPQDQTYFGIYHIGRDVLEYDIRTRIDYNIIRKFFTWEDFLLKTGMNTLIPLQYIIGEKIEKTDILTNYLSDIVFNSDGSVKGIGVYDIEYKETKSGSDINFINDFSNTSKRYNNFLIFNVDKTYKSQFNYKLPIIGGSYRKSIHEKNLVSCNKIKYEDYHQEIIADMIENNIINQDNADFIQSHLSGERYFTLEFDIDVNEKIVNRTVGIVTHNLFREL